MSEFAYKGKTNDSSLIKTGSIEADNRNEARSKLVAEGINIISLKEKKSSLSIDIPFIDNILNRIKLRDKILFTRNLGGMLKSGLPIYRAITILEKQAKNPQFQKVLRDLMSVINGGGSLGDALSKHPKVFPPFFNAMIHAGEESGTLPSSLETIGAYLQKSYELKRKVKGAMMYPAVILSVVGIVGVLMFIFVVPTLVNMFSEIGTELPKSTQIVVWLSDSVQTQGLLLLIILAAFIGGGVYVFRSQKIKPHLHKIVLRLPMIKAMVKEINTARTARTLSSLLDSGVSLVRSIDITEEVVQNLEYKAVLAEAGKRIEKGTSLSKVFSDYPRLYPSMMSEMMEVGEETGNLSQMLLDIAIFYEEEVEAKTKNLSTIIEPVLMVFIGGAVGFFAISMIQPMYSVLETF